MIRLAAGAKLFLIAILAPVAASAFEPPSFEAPELAAEEILKPLLENNRDAFSATMDRMYGESGKTIDNVVFDSFLTDGETFQLADRLKTEKLGNTMVRYLYLLRTSTDDFLFLLVSTIEASRGWVAYDLDFSSELSKYLPDWEDP